MMATKPAATAEAPAPDTDSETTLDTQSGAVKRLIAKGKERGYITFDESEESGEGDAVAARPLEAEDEEAAEPSGNINAETAGRTDDPVRMYLREMGSVELLSREGEIAIAKRIEAGRDMMIGGLC